MPAASVRKRLSSTRKNKAKKQTQDDLYQLECLKAFEVRGGKDYFLVKWEGYSDEQCTWEPVANIVNPTDELLAQMESLRSSHRSKRQSRKRRVDGSWSAGTQQKSIRRPPHREEDAENRPSPARNIHTAEDTSPEETSGQRTKSLRCPNGTKQTDRGEPSPAGDKEVLIREDVSVEAICKEPEIQTFEGQENIPPIGRDTEVLPFLSVMLVKLRVWGKDGEAERMEVVREKRPLLEVAETQTKAMLAYFLRNVRYCRPGKNATTPDQQTDDGTTTKIAASNFVALEAKPSEEPVFKQVENLPPPDKPPKSSGSSLAAASPLQHAASAPAVPSSPFYRQEHARRPDRT